MKAASMLLVAIGLCATLASPGCTEESNPVAWVRELLPPGEDKIAAMAVSEDPDLRRQAIAHLSEDQYMNESRIRQYLITAAKEDPAPSVRAAAARAMGASGRSEFAPHLAEVLSDSNERVRWDAAVALDSVWGQDAVEALRNRLRDDESADVRASSARALRHYPNLDVVRGLVYALDDDSFNVQFQARSALIEITGHRYGYEPEDWRAVASGDQPFKTRTPDKPWWDLLGVSGES